MSDIEQQFFRAFGIARQHLLNVNANQFVDVYPEITAEILLELICIHNIYLETKLYSLEVKNLKDEILQDLIDEQELREIKKDYVDDSLKQQVRALLGG